MSEGMQIFSAVVMLLGLASLPSWKPNLSLVRGLYVKHFNLNGLLFVTLHCSSG